MKHKTLIAAFLAASVLTGCSPAPENAEPRNSLDQKTSAATVTSESEKLASFFEQSYQGDLENSPMTQAYRGIKWDYDKWDDISPEAQDKQIALLKSRLETSKAFDLEKLSDQEKLSLRIYQEDIKRRLANDEFRLQTYIIQQFSSWHTRVPSFLINTHKVTSVNDAHDYIARLNEVDALFSQLNEQLMLREIAGVFPPKWAYDQMIQASNNVISGKPFDTSSEEAALYSDFKEKLASLDVSDSEKTQLLRDAEDALINSVAPAYSKLIANLKKQRELSPEGDGVWRLPNGSEWYQNRLAWFTTTDLTAKEVHELGLFHVERIHEAMRGIMEQVEFEGSLNDFFVFMREDDQFYYPNTDEGREQYLRSAKRFIDIMEEKIPEYFGLIPKAEMVVKRVEAFREQSAGKAFYQSPAADGSRPGIYYANLYDMRSMPIYQMEALAYHEGIPGHHMQRSITQELEGIPDFQKYVNFTAYTEGWGLYTEELAKDMGFYQNPYSDFGRLAMELWRACRLVVDTGIHDMKWSREKAIDYLIENTPNPEYDAIKAIERYIALPGQATAYMVGKLKIMELREKAMEQLGDKFSYAGFHDQVLMYGPIPLNILEERIEMWIESQKAS